MPAWAAACRLAIMPGTASAAIITVLRSIMRSLGCIVRRSIAQRAIGRLSTSRYGRACLLFEHDLRANAFRVCPEGKPVSNFPDHALTQRDDEISAFAGFAALGDAVIRHHDRTA